MHDEACFMSGNTLVKYSGQKTEFTADEQIKLIGPRAFATNLNLRTAKFPYDIAGVEENAFALCSDLTLVQFAGTVGKIGVCAFMRCPKLLYVEMQEGVRSIGDGAFLGSGIVRADIPDSVFDVGSSAFANCRDLATVRLSRRMTVVRPDTFNNCLSLKEIVIPDRVTHIGRSAFSSCTALEHVKFGDNVKVIDESAFSGCSSLEYAFLPSGLTEIKSFAFFSCGKLETVSLPNTCSKIEKKAFLGCKSLRNILCSDEVESFRSGVLGIIWDALYDSDIKIQLISSMLRNYISLVSEEKDVLKKIRANKKKIVELAISDNDASVVDNLFSLYKKISLEELEYFISHSSEAPDVMAYLLSYKNKNYTPGEQEAFETDKIEKELGFRERTLDEWKKLFTFDFYDSIDGSGEFVSITGYRGEDTVVIVPEAICGVRVTQIDVGAFSPEALRIRKEIRENRKRITTVVLPHTIQFIDKSAFAWCENLQSVVIPDNVRFLSEQMFYCCFSLTSVRLPSALLHIGAGAFSSCTALEEIVFPESLEKIEKEAFANCKKLLSVRIPDSTVMIEEGAFANCHALTSIDLGKGLVKIGRSAFNVCKGITKLVIPDSVRKIEFGAFRYCRSLSDVVIPDSVETIEEGILSDTAFYNDRKNWHDGIFYAGNHLLYAEKERFGGYSIRPGTVCIADGAMNGCKTMVNIVIPGSVRNIGSYSFGYCKALRSVQIQDGVKAIHDHAFYSCDKLWKISLPDSIEHLGVKTFTDTSYGRNFDNWENRALYIGKYLISVREHSEGIFTVKEGTRVIASAAFRKCAKITSVIIPSSVVNIGFISFVDCDLLKSVRILDGVKKISDYAFSICRSLNSVIIPDSVTEIGQNAFSGSSPVIYSSRGSYAEKYASQNNLRHSCLTFEKPKK